MKNIKSLGFIAVLALSLTLMSFSSVSKEQFAEDCTLSASGTVESAEFGTMTVTITVTGSCDISLTQKLRAEIARFRAEAAQ